MIGNRMSGLTPLPEDLFAFGVVKRLTSSKKDGLGITGLQML